MPFEKASWIWIREPVTPDQYGEFRDSFVTQGGKTSVRIAADGVSAVYVNGNLAGFSQCSDYPDHKLFDEYDITPLVKEGQNALVIQVWHVGIGSSCYIEDTAGVIYEVVSGNGILTMSGPRTESRFMNEYRNDYRKIITVQMGPSFAYDATVKKSTFSASVPVNKNKIIAKRPQKPLVLCSKVDAEIHQTGYHYLVDLLEETAGFLTLDFLSDGDQDILVSYGEHLVDGSVPRIIGERDFSVEYRAREGMNRYMNPFRRIAGRYLEFEVSEPIEIRYVGITPVLYPLHPMEYEIGNPLDQRIFNACVRTLQLCMHEHYEDCPWREQALYTMDSRNQMLCGYYLFGSAEYQRSNLVLISHGLRKDGLLSLTCPAGIDLPIPFFSLVYVLQSHEYILHTGDVTILEEIGDTLKTIMDTFIERLDGNHLIPVFRTPEYWNFTEWAPYSDGYGENYDSRKEDHIRYDLSLNCMFVHVTEAFRKMFPDFAFDTASIKEAIRKMFYDAEAGLFRVSDSAPHYTQLGNALALLAGLGDESLCEKICHPDGEMVPATLSMLTFVYDALLQADEEKYRDHVLGDIRERYRKMLDAGSNTFWETEEGWQAFGKAGSLCHGWSAIPVYYYCRLLFR